MNLRFLRILTIAAASASLAACGGGGQKNAAATAAPAAAPAATASGSMMMNAKEGPQMQATVPASLNCGSTQVVWVNEHSHVYHYSSDPYYGRTKSGTYMCEADALKKGDHASKAVKPQ